jgi:hypothetical protein
MEGLSAITAWVLVCILFVAASLLAFTSFTLRSTEQMRLGLFLNGTEQKLAYRGLYHKTYYSPNLRFP